MTRNMGTLDRAIRTVIAVVVAVLYFTGRIEGTVGIVLLVFAAVFAVTSFIGSCPAYMLLGISTCEKPKGNGP